jgi:ferritin
MLSKKMLGALNEQINAEIYSSYLYMSMSSYFHSLGLAGFANWMRVQALEEMTHAERFFNYVVDRGGRVVMKAIAGPPTEWESPLAVFQDTLAHEQKVTSLINNLADLAIKEKDHASNNMLQWFISEQVEEEANDQDIIDKLKLVNQTPGGLFMLDKDLGARVFVPPATTAA